MAAQGKIAVYSLSDLKNTTDDALPNYLNSLKFKQSHYHTDIRLALGYTTVVIAGITFLADYKFGWDATKAGTFWAVLVYFTLNGALTLWIWGVEKGKVYTGEIEQSTAERSSLSIASSVTKHVPIYNITVRYESGGQESKTLELSSPFTRWFDADGFFVAKPFQQWLASEIPLIGQADAQNKTSKPAIEGTQDCSSGADHSSEKAKTETPKKSAPNDAVPPSTRSRKGRKSSDR